MPEFVSPWIFRNVATTPDTPLEQWGPTTYRNLLQYGYLSDLSIVAATVRAAPYGTVATTLLECVDNSPELRWSPSMELVVARARGDEEPFKRPWRPRKLVDESL